MAHHLALRVGPENTLIPVDVSSTGRGMAKAKSARLLDRYLCCAEAMKDALRLCCHDDLLVDIPECSALRAQENQSNGRI